MFLNSFNLIPCRKRVKAKQKQVQSRQKQTGALASKSLPTQAQLTNGPSGLSIASSTMSSTGRTAIDFHDPSFDYDPPTVDYGNKNGYDSHERNFESRYQASSDDCRSIGAASSFQFKTPSSTVTPRSLSSKRTSLDQSNFSGTASGTITSFPGFMSSSSSSGYSSPGANQPGETGTGSVSSPLPPLGGDSFFGVDDTDTPGSSGYQSRTSSSFQTPSTFGASRFDTPQSIPDIRGRSSFGQERSVDDGSSRPGMMGAGTKRQTATQALSQTAIPSSNMSEGIYTSQMPSPGYHLLHIHIHHLNCTVSSLFLKPNLPIRIY